MAERRSASSSRSGGSSKSSGGSSKSSGGSRSGGSGSRRNGSRADGLSGRDVIERVREDFPQLLGRRVETVLGLERDDDSGWTVMVEVVELSRIPSSTDVLGSYAVSLDSDGELTGYRRIRRYHRNQADEE